MRRTYLSKRGPYRPPSVPMVNFVLSFIIRAGGSNYFIRDWNTKIPISKGELVIGKEVCISVRRGTTIELRIRKPGHLPYDHTITVGNKHTLEFSYVPLTNRAMLND